MKKIVAAASIAALAASAAFADVKINLNYRVQPNLFQHISTETETVAKTTTTTTNKWFAQDKSKTSASYADATDSFGFKFDGEKAGAQIAFNASSDSGSTATGIAKLNTYNAWMKFDSGLKLTIGAWKDGYADGAYRVKKYADASALQGIDAEANKLGGVYKGTNITFVDDISNFKGGSLSQAVFANYALLDGALDLTAGLVHTTLNDATIDTDDDADVTNNTAVFSGPVLRALYKGDALNAQFIWKNAAVKEHAFGLYVMPKIDSNLILNVGGAVGLTRSFNDKGAQSQSSSDMTLETWAVDLRAQYKVDALTITTFNSVQQICLERGAKDAKYDAGDYQYGKPLVAGANDGKASNMAMWNFLGAMYDIDETFTAGMGIGLLTPLSIAQKAKDTDAAESLGVQFRITPWLQIRAASNAFVDIGVSFGTTKSEVTKGTEVSVTEFAIPMVLRVKM